MHNAERLHTGVVSQVTINLWRRVPPRFTALASFFSKLPRSRHVRDAIGADRTNHRNGLSRRQGTLGPVRDQAPLLFGESCVKGRRLYVDVVIREQKFAGAATLMRVADNHRQDVARRVEDRHAAMAVRAKIDAIRLKPQQYQGSALQGRRARCRELPPVVPQRPRGRGPP
jgi:hypothetical protein